MDRRAARGAFRPEHHDADPVESGRVTVEAVRSRGAPGEPFTPYGFRPHSTFLAPTGTRRGGWSERSAYAAAAPVPSWLSSPSSGSLQTRSRKKAAAMTPMPATTAAPA